MKATGIIRRIDDLGRFCIPKEIRISCNLNENDPLEIFIGEDNDIILRPYLRFRQPWRILKEAVEAMQDNPEFNYFAVETEDLIRRMENTFKPQ